jgi:hypothetical protein
MKMRLAGLLFVIGGHLHIHIVPCVRPHCHSFSVFFVGLDLKDSNHYKKRNKKPGLCLRLNHGVKFLFSLVGKPANRRFCRGTTRNEKFGIERQMSDGQASPLDCDKTAKMMPYEDAS